MKINETAQISMQFVWIWITTPKRTQKHTETLTPQYENNKIHKMFYKKGKKYIHPEIENYLTPLALAIWIMDDGGWTKYGVRIATNDFKLTEVEFLIKVLKNKFNLDCTIQYLKDIDRYSIYVNFFRLIKRNSYLLQLLWKDG